MISQPTVVLLVEDDRSQQELTLAALRHIGVTEDVRCVSSGDAAIAYIHGEGKYHDRATFPLPALIITDLQMPHGDGYSLLRYVTSHPAECACPVVVFSSSDDDEHISKARRLGASGYIVKPIAFSEICEVLRALFLWHLGEHAVDLSPTKAFHAMRCPQQHGFGKH
jgi:CheY-like chemotaxis protein